MKRLLLSSTAWSAALLAAPALAADLPVKAPPAPPPPAVYNWTGFYLGLTAGAAFAHSGDPTTTASCAVPPGFGVSYFGFQFGCSSIATVAAAGTGSMSGTAFTGGGQAGYNWQNGAAVFGVETDIESFNVRLSRAASGALSGTNFTITNSASADWLFTARGRVGWAFDRLLAYATGGLAVTNLKSNNTYADNAPGPFGPGVGSWGASSTKVGWTVGGGLEYAFASNWTAKIEYLYVKFNAVNASGLVVGTPGTGYASAINTTTDLSASIVRGGINYKF